MRRLSFIFLILTLCTLATCGIVPFFRKSGLGEEFESAEARTCRKEEQKRCKIECHRITKKVVVRCYKPEKMYCYCITKKRRLPSFENFYEAFQNIVEGNEGDEEEEEADEKEETEFRGCRLKSAKGVCEEVQPAY